MGRHSANAQEVVVEAASQLAPRESQTVGNVRAVCLAAADLSMAPELAVVEEKESGQ
jgi:hypothetical protein